MVNRIEELGDIQIQHPVPLPASLATLRHRIQRRPLRPIPVRIIMENRFRTRQQLQRNHRLGDSVGHSRNPEDPGAPTVRLRYLHGPHRGWKVGPRGHPVPDPVEIVLQICFECLDGLPIHPSGTLICLDALVRLPHQSLRDLKRLVLRFRLAHSSPPRRNAWLLAQNKSQMSRPLRSASITEVSALLRAGPPACPHRYSTPHSFCCSTHSLSPPTTLSGSRSPYRHTPSHVPCSSRRPDSRHLHTGHRLAGKRIFRQAYPEVIHTPRF